MDAADGQLAIGVLVHELRVGEAQEGAERAVTRGAEVQRCRGAWCSCVAQGARGARAPTCGSRTASDSSMNVMVIHMSSVRIISLVRSMPSALLRVGSAVVSSAVSLAVCAGWPSTATSTSSYDVTCSLCPSDLDAMLLVANFIDT